MTKALLVIDVQNLLIDEQPYAIADRLEAWADMIDQAHQGKGYGRAVLEAVIEIAKQHPIYNHVRVDYVKGNDKMAHLLNALGFETFDQDGREILTKLDLE